MRFDEGGYRTAGGRPGLLARCFPSAGFYARFLKIVWRSAAAARRGVYGDAQWSSSSLVVMRALEAVGIQIAITGVDRFSRIDGPCVFIGNHMSSFEAFVLPTIIQPVKKVSFVVKQSLVDYPIFGHVMRSRDPIVVGRTNPREDLKAVFEGGARRLTEGISIIVFPQTTRTACFDPGAFNSIGIKLAKRAQVPIVPIALKTDAWGNGRHFKDFGKIDPRKAVHITFGEPLRVQGSGAEQQRQIIDFISENLRAWGGMVLDAPAPAEC